MPWPGDIESVTVIWTDDRKETYLCNTVKVEDGVLKLSMVYKGSIGLSNDQVRDERSFPLANVRVYAVNRVS